MYISFYFLMPTTAQENMHNTSYEKLIVSPFDLQIDERETQSTAIYNIRQQELNPI